MAADSPEKFEYKKLDSRSKRALRKKCLCFIRDESNTGHMNVFLDKVEDFLTCKCLCRNSCNFFSGEEDENRITILIGVLSDNCTTKKMFYHKVDEQQCRKMAKIVYEGGQLDFTKVDVYLLAGTLKVYCESYLDYYLPKDIHFTLLMVYQNNNRFLKQEVIRRIPFIMNKETRLFFLELFNLFKCVSKNFMASETSLDNILDIFGPLVIKSPANYTEFNGFTKREILKDLMDVDFEYFTGDIL